MRWARHVARVGEREVFTRYWLGCPKGTDHWEDTGIGEKMTLR